MDAERGVVQVVHGPDPNISLKSVQPDSTHVFPGHPQVPPPPRLESSAHQQWNPAGWLQAGPGAVAKNAWCRGAYRGRESGLLVGVDPRIIYPVRHAAPQLSSNFRKHMYIVTGGAGFIGSNLVRGLNRNGIDEIVIVDDLENGEKHLGLNSLDFADFIDWRDLQGSWEVLLGDGVEAVFHQGACSDTMEADGRYMMEANFESSKEVLHACLDTETPFFYASSASVYGDGERGFREEVACEAPLNIYAYSKFLFDQYVRRIAPTAGSQIGGLRYFNVFGPQENHKGRMASVIYHFHKQIAEKGELRLFEGSEGFVRDFIHVDDVVALNLWLLENPDVSGIFNAGTGTERSFLDLAKLVVEGTGGKASIGTIPFPEALVGKYQAYTCADQAELREAGCEHEFLSLEAGVASYVKQLNETGGLYLRSE